MRILKDAERRSEEASLSQCKPKDYTPNPGENPEYFGFRLKMPEMAGVYGVRRSSEAAIRGQYYRNKIESNNVNPLNK